MSRKNVEIVRRAWDAWERGDLAGLLETMSDDVVTVRVGLDNVTYYGKQGFLELTADWSEAFAEWSATPEEFLDAGDRVVVRNHHIARGDTSGAPVESDFWYVYTIRGGKIIRQDFFASRDEALEAAGLRE
jgi:ketosteroid isomerase-like protein